MANQVRFISTTTIKQAAYNNEATTHHHRIELSPWDLRFLLFGPIQKGLLFSKPTSLQQRNLLANTIIDHLKSSLSRALDFFPPLAGRLVAVENDENTSSFFISCNGAGVHFIHAIGEDVALSHILEPLDVPPVVHSFFPLNGVQNWEGVSKPLLAVQVTELVDGFFIGCSMNHTVGDGSSFWHFLNSWSEISRGLEKIPQPPVLERWFPTEINYPIGVPLNLRDNKQVDDEFIPTPPFQERIFHFTKEKIARLKVKANTEMGTNQISSLQSLLAHIWRSVVRCQGIDPTQETNYRIVIGVRPRLNPPLPGHYFGNAIYPKIISTKMGELLERGLGWAAWEMNKVISSQTDEEVRKFVEDWVKDPKLWKISALKNNDFLTSSSPRFNMYGNDFGWGKPLAVRSGEANKGDGMITVFPGVEEGSIDIEICLLPEKLYALGEDEEFMDTVSTS